MEEIDIMKTDDKKQPRFTFFKKSKKSELDAENGDGDSIKSSKSNKSSSKRGRSFNPLKSVRKAVTKYRSVRRPVKTLEVPDVVLPEIDIEKLDEIQSEVSQVEDIRKNRPKGPQGRKRMRSVRPPTTPQSAQIPTLIVTPEPSTSTPDATTTSDVAIAPAQPGDLDPTEAPTETQDPTDTQDPSTATPPLSDSTDAENPLKDIEVVVVEPEEEPPTVEAGTVQLLYPDGPNVVLAAGVDNMASAGVDNMASAGDGTSNGDREKRVSLDNGFIKSALGDEAEDVA